MITLPTAITVDEIRQIIEASDKRISQQIDRLIEVTSAYTDYKVALLSKEIPVKRSFGGWILKREH